MTQLIAVGTTMLFCGVMTLAILKLVALIVPLRVPMGSELNGLDVSEHGESAHDFDELGVGQGGHSRPTLGGSVLVHTMSMESRPATASPLA
jgi:Amt family ammonium transporter